MQFVWLLVALAIVGGLAWVAWGMEPHWVAKDGMAFSARIQPLGNHLQPDGRWREARCFIEDSVLHVRERRIMASARPADRYDVVNKSDDPPRGKVVYLLAARSTGPGFAATNDLAAIRIPNRSRAVPNLDALVAKH
jgi:hypothetical protein